MVYLRPEHFPSGAFQKLHHRRADPFKILARLGSNAYHLELPSNFPFSFIFDIEALTAYSSHFEDEQFDAPAIRDPTHSPPREKIEAILDYQFVSTRRGGYQKFLVKSKNRPLSNCCWLQTEEVQCLNPDLYDDYIAHHSSELISFTVWGEIVGVS